MSSWLTTKLEGLAIESSETIESRPTSTSGENGDTSTRPKRFKRSREPKFVIPALPEFHPPETIFVNMEERDPNIPRIFLPEPKFFEGPEPTGPKGDKFDAIYLGTDKNNRVILRFTDEINGYAYSCAKQFWGVFLVTLGKKTKIPFGELEVGLVVTACNKRNGFDHYFRAQVITIDETKSVTVRDVDEWDEIVVDPDNLYHMNEAFMNIHFQAIACELRGFNFIKGVPVIKQIMDESLRECFPLKCGVRVTEFEGRHPHPLLKFSSLSYRATAYSVTEELENILKIWGPQLPSPNVFCHDVLISHADEVGNIWYQASSNLTHILTHLEVPTNILEINANAGKSEANQMSIVNLLGSGESIFVGRYEDGSYYRVRVLEFFPDEKSVLVDFIDFGNALTLKLADIFPCDSFCEEGASLLKSIVPQCLKVHLNKIDVLNTEKFWEHVRVDMRMHIKVSAKQKKDRRTPQVELYTPQEEGLHHLNMFFLFQSDMARNLGDREVATYIRIPGTKRFLTNDIVASVKADYITSLSPSDIEDYEEDFEDYLDERPGPSGMKY